jgi:pimeloyl-ACP methyl ester carboxylesterase
MNRRQLGVLAGLTGVAAAGVAAGVVAERRAATRARDVPDPLADEPFGELHAPGVVVYADDGVPLHCEVVGPDDADVTVVFIHGFALSMDSWHFQRRDLDLPRMVFFDQRSHGASGRSPRENATIDQLGRDLHSLLQAVVPRGRVVLVGHSMGGMTLLALADRHPELFGDRVIGAGLISTAAGAFAETIFGLPGLVGRALRPVAPGLIRAANRQAHLLEQGRRAGSDVAYMLTRRFSYGGNVPPSLVAFVERMLTDTPVEVMTEFFDTFLSHDKLKALEKLSDLPTLILCGDRDMITPVKNSHVMSDALPGAELIVVEGSGHMVMLEQPDLVNNAITQLVHRAVAAAPRIASA